MYFINILLIIIFIISFIIILLNFILSKKSLKDREKISPFECGFDPISSHRLPFRIQFFLIRLIFLIFDVEITLLIPLTYLTQSYNLPIILTSLIFLLILIYGLYIEYLEKSIDWKK